MRQLVCIFVLCGLFSWESWCQSLTEQEQLLREGRRLEECLDYQSAYPVYQRCLALDSTSVEAINAMARVSMNMGKTGEARSFFQKTLRQDSTNFLCQLSAGTPVCDGRKLSASNQAIQVDSAARHNTSQTVGI